MKYSIEPAKLLRCGNQDVYWLSSEASIPELDLFKSLHSDDAEYVKTIKSYSRKEEFLRSRWLMAKIGVLPEDKPTRTSDGVPQFKGNVPGSISHKSGQVICAISRSENLLSIGIDLEDVNRVHPGLAERICVTSELAMLDKIHPTRDAKWNRGLCLIFSFKEALFKAHYPLGRTMFWFHDAQVLELPNSIDKYGSLTGKVLKATSNKTPAESITTADFISTDIQGKLDSCGTYITTVVQV